MTTVLLIITSSAVFCSLIASYVLKVNRDDVFVKRVTEDHLQDIKDFKALYNKTIHTPIRVPAEEIIGWIKAGGRRQAAGENPVSHYLMLSKVKNKAVGFMEASYHADSKLMLIGYYGVDRGSTKARKTASVLMIRYLLKILHSEARQCKGVLFEIESPDAAPDLIEQSRRRARMRLFKGEVKKVGFDIYRICLDYVQPCLNLADIGAGKEMPMYLMYIVFGGQAPDGAFSRPQMIEILTFIYLHIYARKSNPSEQQSAAYAGYLAGLIDGYALALPETVPLER